MKKTPLTVVAGIVTLIALLVLMVIMFAATGSKLDPGQKMIIVTVVAGLVSNAIPGLLALFKSEATQHELRNGLVTDKVKDAVHEMAADGNDPVVIVPNSLIENGKETESDG